MAIVFVSPRKKQRRLLMALVGLFVLVAVGIAGFVFLPDITTYFVGTIPVDVASSPIVNINFSLVDSGKLQNLEAFTLPAAQFSYIAKDSAGKAVSGVIVAVGLQEAVIQLESQGMVDIQLKEANLGRQNPFASATQAASTTQLKK